MPRSWSEAKKNCARRGHATKDKRGRWCRCDGPGWRYRMALPDPTTGALGKPAWSKTFKTKEAADQHQRKMRDAIAEGTYASDLGKTVGEYLRELLETRRLRGASPTSLATLEGQFNHCIHHIGHLRLGELQPRHIQAMLDKLATTISTHPRSKGRPIAPVTINNIRGALSAALAEAVRLQYISQNWVDRVPPVKVRKKKPIDIGRQRAAAFLQYVADDRLAAMWMLFVLYPTRRAEILGLRWPDVDRAGRVFEIVQTLTNPKGLWPCPFCPEKHSRQYFGPAKTEAGERPIPLIDVVDVALALHQEKQDQEKAAHDTDYSDHALIFCEADGLPLSPQSVSRSFKLHMAAAGLIAPGETISLKSLRSSAVTALHEDGVDLEVITAVTGHRPDGQVTRGHYLRVKGERARGPFEAIAQVLLESPQPKS